MSKAETRDCVLLHFAGLGFWRPHWSHTAVVVVGSALREEADEFSDVDIEVYVLASAYPEIYDGHRRAYDAGLIQVMNPLAFQYQEFPFSMVPGVNGHYRVHTFEELEERIRGYDDVSMWIHAQSLVLHDLEGRYRALQAQSRTYPKEVWRSKARSHYLAAVDAAGAASNPLRRNDRPAVILTMTDCFAHLLRLCCLLESRPFPYDKWLYREALGTRAGRDLQQVFEGFFDEIARPEIRRVTPEVLERPDHRKADLEQFPLYLLWRKARVYFDRRLAELPSA